MATRFLSDAELERLECFPAETEAPDLARYFRLDGDDLDFVCRQHSPAGQLGIALQLCALRWLGFIPDDLPSAAEDAIAALAEILDAEPRVNFDYSACPQTRREHRPLGREHAGFRAAGERELEPVGSWLIEQASTRPLLLLAETPAANHAADRLSAPRGNFRQCRRRLSLRLTRPGLVGSASRFGCRCAGLGQPPSRLY
jgi:Domain of unknown function (DUF4158)